MNSFLANLFGCAHPRCSFPITTRSPHSAARTYIVCLDCGREFAYDWQQMKVIAAPPPDPKISAAKPAFIHRRT